MQLQQGGMPCFLLKVPHPKFVQCTHLRPATGQSSASQVLWLLGPEDGNFGHSGHCLAIAWPLASVLEEGHDAVNLLGGRVGSPMPVNNVEGDTASSLRNPVPLRHRSAQADCTLY